MLIQERIEQTINNLSENYKFVEGTEHFLNLLADQTHEFPVAWISTPVKSKDEYTQSGYIRQTYSVLMMFLERSQLDWIPKQHNPLHERQRKISREFILTLKDNEGIESIGNVTTTDIVNALDANASGVAITFDITPRMDDLNICINRCPAVVPVPEPEVPLALKTFLNEDTLMTVGSANIQFVTEMTFAKWMNINDAHPEIVGSFADTFGSTNKLFIGTAFFSNNEDFFFYIWNWNDAPTNAPSLSLVPIPYNRIALGWFHLTAIKTETDIKLFINGELVHTAEVTSNWLNGNSIIHYGNDTFGGGGEPESADKRLTVLFDDIKIYNRALTDEEVLLTYQGTDVDTITQGWNFNQGAANPVLAAYNDGENLDILNPPATLEDAFVNRP